MPGLVRKLLIFAAVDGLVLQPLAQRGQRPAPATKIAYEDNNIEYVWKDGGEGYKAGKGFEAFGIVGTCPQFGALIQPIKTPQHTKQYQVFT
jgi:murein L,D-transpeptidase YcbB/YkuD